MQGRLRSFRLGNTIETQTTVVAPTARRRLSATIRSSLGRNNRRRTRNKLQSEVFWQSVSYLCALYLGWFCYVVVVSSFDTFLCATKYYELWICISFMYPLTAFSMRVCVNFRARFVRTIKYVWHKSRKLSLAPSNHQLVLSQQYAGDLSEPDNNLVEQNEIKSSDGGNVEEDTQDRSIPEGDLSQ